MTRLIYALIFAMFTSLDGFNVFFKETTTATNWPFDNNGSESSDEFFNRLDTNNDSLLDEHDYLKRDRFYVEMTRREFAKTDQNHDGNVTKQELHNYNKKRKDERHDAELSASKITLNAFDGDSDQALSLEELDNYVRHYLHRRTENLGSVFAKFDTNNDTKLDLQEFSKLDFAFPWDKFPVNFEVPPSLLDQPKSTTDSHTKSSTQASKTPSVNNATSPKISTQKPTTKKSG